LKASITKIEADAPYPEGMTVAEIEERFAAASITVHPYARYFLILEG